MSLKGKKFGIAGDYDVDGVMATVIMITTLMKLGYNITSDDFKIPNRLTQHYGLDKADVDDLHSKGIEVIITVDSGISLKEVIEYAESLGMIVIVTDHHLPEEGTIPNCLIVDPAYNNDDFIGICGAYVAFKLMYELILRESNVKNLFDIKGYDISNLVKENAAFAAFATVADMMPLQRENRFLIRFAYDTIDFYKSKNIWAGRLLKVISGLGGRNFLKSNELANEELLSFQIAPSINAVSRVWGDVTSLVKDIIECDGQGKYINGYYEANIERKDNTRELVNWHVRTSDPVSIDFLDTSEFSFPIKGLIGLMANKISSEENKPSLVGYEGADGFYEFSSRSVQGYSIYDAMQRIKEQHPELNITGGGHDGAMGFKFDGSEENLALLRKALNEDVKNNFTKKEKIAIEIADDTIDDLLTELMKYVVFGNSFRKPCLYYKGNCTAIDDEEHKVTVGDFVFQYYSDNTIANISVGNEVEVYCEPIFSVPGNILFKIKSIK